jgi:DNA-binding transcriptional MerR regulator
MSNKDHAGTFPLKLGFTREETARAIGQSPATLDRLAERGLIRPSRATRRPIYSLEEIERFLRETTVEVEP